MVRLLLVTIFFLNLGAYAHDQASGEDGCERQLKPYETMRYHMYGFLKKLTNEIDERFPENRYYRLGIGRASGPLIASLREDGKQAASLPIRINFQGLLSPAQESRFNAVVKFYLPPADELKGKSLLLLIYDEDARAFVSFAAQLEWYLSQHKIPVENVSVQFLTSQDRLAYIDGQLARSFSGDKSRFHVRPLALSNEVRHWLHDSLGDQHSGHEFLLNDVLKDSALKLSFNPRPQFLDLVADLGQLPPRMRPQAK